jgi:choline-phosphate cytidylyltransferase
MNEQERAEQVLHCRYVDEVVVRSPWVLTQEFLDEYNIDFVVHGEDNSYDDSGNDAYAFVKKQGKYKTIKRTDGVSTTDLIIRILKDYNGYVERCMRRGFTHQDLNIPENVWVRQFWSCQACIGQTKGVLPKPCVSDLYSFLFSTKG